MKQLKPEPKDEDEEEHLWIACGGCGNETDASLKDCKCENCDAFDWSSPYKESGEEVDED